MNDPKKKIAPAIVLAAFLPGIAQAAGLATGVGEVKLHNLQPGRTYSMEQLAHFPYSVSNLSRTGEEMDIVLRVKDPGGTLKPGYEPLPDLSWVKVDRTSWRNVPAQQGVRTDVKITIPKDERLRGRAFQFNIEAAGNLSRRPEAPAGGVHGGYIDVVLISRFLLTIAERKTDVPGTTGRAYPIDIQPPSIFFGKVELGRVYDIAERGQAFSLINPRENKRPLRIRLEVLNAPQAESGVLQGFPDIPDPRYLLLEKTEYFLEAGESVPIGLTLFFPKRQEFARKNYMFVLHAETVDSPIPFGVHVRLYVSTGDLK